MSGDIGPEERDERPPAVAGLRDLRPLGRGGFGTVFRAWQTGVGREVALKVDSRVLTDERDRRRFLREASAAGRLSSHANIVPVYDAGVAADGRPYLVMELCRRGSLVDLVREDGPLPPEEVRTIGVGIADALATAHAAGVLHRDVKPGNILVDEHGVAKLADFGLAAVLDAGGDSSATREGLTPAYAPPEAFAFARPTALLDVYGLAATLYAVLAGRPPRAPSWPPKSLAELTAGLHAPVPPVPGAHPDLLAVLSRALDPEPDQRTPSAAALRDALRDLAAAALPGPAPKPAVSPADAASALVGPSATLPSLSYTPGQLVAGESVGGQSVGGQSAARQGIDHRSTAGGGPTGAQHTAGAVVGAVAGGSVDGDRSGAGGPVAGSAAGPARARWPRRRVAVVTVPLLAVAVAVATFLLHRPDPAAAPTAAGGAGGPATPSRTGTVAPTAPPTASRSGRSRSVPAGPHGSGATTTTPPVNAPASSAADGSLGLPGSLVGCAGSAGNVLCPTSPACWDALVPVVTPPQSAPPPTDCGPPHHWEAYAAGRLPTDGDPRSEIAQVCTSERMQQRFRAGVDTKHWSSSVQPLRIDRAWFFYCVASPKTKPKGSPVTGTSFRVGP
jgi:hypothetical protein